MCLSAWCARGVSAVLRNGCGFSLYDLCRVVVVALLSCVRFFFSHFVGWRRTGVVSWCLLGLFVLMLVR